MELKKEYYENGFLRSEGFISNGSKQGIWTSYFETGKMESQVNYINGLRSGCFKRWFENGHLAIEAFYEEGNLIGIYKEFYNTGSPKEIGIHKQGEYFPIDFWNEMGNQILKDGTGVKIEKYGHSGIDIFEQYYEKGKFINEVRK